VKLLLDTHTFLWHAASNSSLSSMATTLLGDPANELFLSMASLWELAIKVGIKKLTLSASFDDFMKRAIDGYGIAVLPITFGDCADYQLLPFLITNHRDPFDRMIIIHARRNSLSIIGNDTAFDAYGITRFW
jgi:PIN domain nuclease of toxin-antitoxin system